MMATAQLANVAGGRKEPTMSKPTTKVRPSSDLSVADQSSGDRRSIELSAGTMEYHDEGDGPVVLCVHGALVDARLFEPFAKALGSSYRIIRPELPLGAHRVPLRPEASLAVQDVADLVAELMEALDLQDVTLIGNDTGGAICQHIAVNHPERLGRLVLTPSDAFEVCPPRMFAYFHLLPRIPGGIWATGQTMRSTMLRRLPMAYGRLGKRLPAKLTGSWVAALGASAGVRRDFAKVLRGLNKQKMIETSRALANFDRPTLLVWGDDDFGFPLSLAERLRDTLPEAELVVLDDATVFVPLDQPEALAELVRQRVPSLVAR